MRTVQEKTKPLICLSMIVKNESKNMAKCLESAKDVIDYYIINDNGSNDGTPELIKQIMDGYKISGEVYSSPWVNFGHNREEALQRIYQDGRWDYCLFMDADNVLHHEDGVFGDLTADCYLIEWRLRNLVYKVPGLLSLKKEWHWKGVVHNYITGDGKTKEVLNRAWMAATVGGGAKALGLTSQEKFLKDAVLLEGEMKKDPTDARSQFYLAQSYKDAGKLTLAYKHYMRRVALGGWEEEVYTAMYQGAICKWKAERVFPLDDFLVAYNYRPSRAEPLHQVAKNYREAKMYSLAYLFAKVGVSISYPEDVLFVEKDIYEWRLLDELSISAYWTGKYAESLELCDGLLTNPNLPEREVDRVKKNREFAVEKTNADKQS